MVIDYREAFDEWLKLDPLNNPSATPGPPYMPGYKNPNLEEAEQLNTEAEELFTEGTEAGEMAGKYVRQTVLFALVLFLIAAGQRFTQRPVRISANALAVCLLIYTLGYLTILPRSERGGAHLDRPAHLHHRATPQRQVHRNPLRLLRHNRVGRVHHSPRPVEPGRPVRSGSAT
jgi:hypothetical protein